MDNSTQNYYDHRAELLQAYRKDGGTGKLRIEIVYDGENNSLSVIDNANGMNFSELTRAVVLDKPPPDRSGRCEYGMGLKTAACWFGSTWTVRTCRLGTARELTAVVRVPDLVEKHTEVIPVQEKLTSPEDHFTIITINDLYKPIRGRTFSRILDQLGSMYRHDLRSGEVEILWNGQPVAFEEPQFLTESFNGGEIVWRKNLAFEVPWDTEIKSLRVNGWVGIRTPGSQRDAGFALMRRGRVIVGGPGEGYKPVEVFGQGNTFRSQRLVGELYMDAWPVTQAKDAFDWSGGLEDVFIEKLKVACQDYMDKSEGYREKNRPLMPSDVELASEKTREVFANRHFGTAIAEEITFPDPPKTSEQEVSDVAKLKELSVGPVTYRLEVGPDIWIFRLHWQDQLSDAHWMQVDYPQDHEIDIYLNIAHPFIVLILRRKNFSNCYRNSCWRWHWLKRWLGKLPLMEW